jgi:hypothetical protein
MCPFLLRSVDTPMATSETRVQLFMLEIKGLGLGGKVWETSCVDSTVRLRRVPSHNTAFAPIFIFWLCGALSLEVTSGALEFLKQSP